VYKIWLHVLFNAFCSQSAKQGKKSVHNVPDRRVSICASWILWQMVTGWQQAEWAAAWGPKFVL